jgi:hypothetical protein
VPGCRAHMHSRVRTQPLARLRRWSKVEVENSSAKQTRPYAQNTSTYGYLRYGELPRYGDRPTLHMRYQAGQWAGGDGEAGL